MRKNYFNILREMTISDFRLRYQGSILGVFWSFLRPLVMFAVLYIVFSKFARFDIEYYPLYLLIGVLSWNFFAEATSSAMSSLVSRTGLVRKINFPRNIVIISSTLIAFLNFFLGFFIFLVFLFIRKGIVWAGVLNASLLFIDLFLVALGSSFFLAALNSKFKDVSHLWELLLPIGFWLTPIIYSAKMVPTEYGWLLLVNPIYHLIEHSRSALLYGSVLDLASFFKLLLFSFMIFALGLLFFQRRQKYFAEEL